MASTNKTTHYELSQYVGTDKPTYLTDYNNDMSAIDTGIYNAQDKADSAYTLANTADGKADTGITNAGLAQTDASSALTKIGNLSNLNTTEKTNLVGAINENKRNIDNFNLSTFEVPTNVATNVGTLTNSDLHVAKNSDGSIAKVYGTADIGSIPAGTSYVEISFNTTLRPESDLTINCVAFARQYGVSSPIVSNIVDLSLDTTGVGKVRLYLYSDSTVADFKLIPVLLFVKDFGDTPAPQN